MSTPELSPGEFDRLELARLAEELDALTRRVRDIEQELSEDPPKRGYEPIPAPRWWRLTTAEREEAAARLDGWVADVYRPVYGKIAARLPACWDEHVFCLAVLDWLSELHSVLYLQPQRSPSMLAGQAEWTTRILPAAAEQMADEARGCQHGGKR